MAVPIGARPAQGPQRPYGSTQFVTRPVSSLTTAPKSSPRAAVMPAPASRTVPVAPMTSPTASRTPMATSGSSAAGTAVVTPAASAGSYTSAAPQRLGTERAAVLSVASRSTAPDPSGGTRIICHGSGTSSARASNGTVNPAAADSSQTAVFRTTGCRNGTTGDGYSSVDSRVPVVLKASELPTRAEFDRIGSRVPVVARSLEGTTRAENDRTSFRAPAVAKAPEPSTFVEFGGDGSRGCIVANAPELTPGSEFVSSLSPDRVVNAGASNLSCVEYWSKTHGGWIDAKVVAADPVSRAIQIDKKPGVWLGPEDQKSRIRGDPFSSLSHQAESSKAGDTGNIKRASCGAGQAQGEDSGKRPHTQETSGVDEVSDDGFELYADTVASTLSRGQSVIRDRLLSFMLTQSKDLAPVGATVRSSFPAFDVRTSRPDEFGIERIVIELAMQRGNGSFVVEYKAQCWLFATKDSSPQASDQAVAEDLECAAAQAATAAPSPTSAGAPRTAAATSGKRMVREVVKYRCPSCSTILDTMDEALHHCAGGVGGSSSSSAVPKETAISAKGMDGACGLDEDEGDPLPLGEPVAYDARGRPSIVRQVDPETGEAKTFVRNEDGSPHTSFGKEFVLELAGKSAKDAKEQLEGFTNHQLRGLVHEVGQRLLQNSQLYHRRLEELKSLGERLNYQYFGLDIGASEKDLEAAYRKMAKRMHPDKNGGTEEAKRRFQDMKERYEVLKKRYRDGQQAASDGGNENGGDRRQKGSSDCDGRGEDDTKAGEGAGSDDANDAADGDEAGADEESNEEKKEPCDEDPTEQDDSRDREATGKRKGRTESGSSKEIAYDPQDRRSMEKTATKMLEQLQTIEVQMKPLMRELMRARGFAP